MKPLYVILYVCLFATLPPAVALAQGGTIADVRFIEGSWKADAGERSIDAVWSAPDAGNITGYVRATKGGKVVLYELFAFEQTANGLEVFVRHFSPGLVAAEEKDKPVHYNFVEAGDGRALFEMEGQAVRVLYEKRSANEFAIVVGKQQDGEWVFKDFWKFKRVK